MAARQRARIAQLMQYGFDEDECKRALELANGSLEQAMHHLLETETVASISPRASYNLTQDLHALKKEALGDEAKAATIIAERMQSRREEKATAVRTPYADLSALDNAMKGAKSITYAEFNASEARRTGGKGSGDLCQRCGTRRAAQSVHIDALVCHFCEECAKIFQSLAPAQKKEERTRLEAMHGSGGGSTVPLTPNYGNVSAALHGNGNYATTGLMPRREYQQVEPLPADMAGYGRLPSGRTLNAAEAAANGGVMGADGRFVMYSMLPNRPDAEVDPVMIRAVAIGGDASGTSPPTTSVAPPDKSTLSPRNAAAANSNAGRDYGSIAGARGATPDYGSIPGNKGEEGGKNGTGYISLPRTAPHIAGGRLREQQQRQGGGSGGGNGGGRRHVPLAFMDGDDDLSVYEWFHGKISFKDAEQLLAGTADGTYLVRCGSSAPFVLCFMYKGKSVKFQIQVSKESDGNDNRRYCVQTASGTVHYRSVLAIVDAYKSRLKVPVSRLTSTVFDKDLRNILTQ